MKTELGIIVQGYNSSCILLRFIQKPKMPFPCIPVDIHIHFHNYRFHILEVWPTEIKMEAIDQLLINILSSFVFFSSFFVKSLYLNALFNLFFLWL